MTLYLFSNYKLDTTKSELYLDDKALKAEPQTIAILELLVERAGEIVLKEELIEKIWDGRIIARSVLDNRIRSVRQLIGDTGKDQAFIKTYPNRGYKFVADVTHSDLQQSGNISRQIAMQTPDAAPPIAREAFADSFSQRKRTIVFAAMATLAVAALTVFATLAPPSSKVTSPILSAVEVVPTISNASDFAEHTEPVLIMLPVETSGEVSAINQAVARSVWLQTRSLFAAIEGMQVKSLSSSGDELGAATPAAMGAYLLSGALNETSGADTLVASLTDAQSGTVVWSKQYALPSQSTDSLQLEEEVARNVSLNSANKMGVSTSVIRQHQAVSDFSNGYQNAMRLMRNLDEDSIARARGILGVIIAEEPDYLPAYAGLYDTHYLELNHSNKPLDVVLEEMGIIAGVMTALAPEAPETLTVKALQVDFNMTNLAHPSDQPLDLLTRAAAKAPHYFRAHEELAYLHSVLGQVDQSLRHYDIALEYFPNCPILLAEKSSAQMCGGHEIQALGTANLNIRRNPDHVTAINNLIRFAMYTGDYDAIKEQLPGRLDNDQAGYQERIMAMNWSLSVGDYQAARAFAVDPPQIAYVEALNGNRDAVERFVGQMPGYYLSAKAMHALGDASILFELLETEFEQSSGLHTAGHDLSICQIYNAVYIAQAVQTHDRIRFEVIKDNVDRYFAANPLEHFNHVDEYAALMAYQSMLGDPNAAIGTLKAANERGLIFLHRFDEPAFQRLMDHPEFQEEVMKMTSTAAVLRSQVVLAR